MTRDAIEDWDAETSPPTRDETFDWAQRATTLAARLNACWSLRRMDGTVVKIDTPEFRSTIFDQALEFLRDLTLDVDRVPAIVLLDRLRVYQTARDEHDRVFWEEPEAVFYLCFVLLAYEKAHCDFVSNFADDEEIIIELAMAGESTSSLMRGFSNGSLPNVTDYADVVPHLVFLIESLRSNE